MFWRTIRIRCMDSGSSKVIGKNTKRGKEEESGNLLLSLNTDYYKD